jgi:hypothetical protein
MPNRTPPETDRFDRGPLSRDAAEEKGFCAGGDLLDEVRRILDEIDEDREWTMTPGALKNVFQGTFASATQTYGAMLLLCDRGYGTQAGMLNRSLFENAVVVWWMHLHENPTEVIELLRKHHEHSRVLWDRAAELHPELQLPPTTKIRAPDESDIADLDRLFGRYGNSWYRKPLVDLVRDVEDRWDENYPGMFWKFLRFVNHWNNSMLHHSSAAVTTAIEWNTIEQPPTLRLGPDREWTQGSLWAGFWCYGLLVLGVLRRLSPDRAAPFAAVLDKLGMEFVPMSREQVPGVGRNDLCPCGSGKKFKRCHGA